MVTASEIPFELQVIKRFPQISCQNGLNFSNDAKEIWKNQIITFSVEENDDIDLKFDSEDSNAKLYLDALDIILEDDGKIAYDDNGYIYRMPAREPFALYRADRGYDALCVDIFQISVFCYNTWYYGTFQVLPKPMDIGEWTMMKDELEQEMEGLAQDIVLRNMGVGKLKNKNVPSKVLYDFIVIKKYAQPVLGALLDIAENPRCEIMTQYKKISHHKNCRLDGESIRRYVTRAGAEATYKSPQKVTNYDIQDNRLLKRIILDFEKRLNQFLVLLEEIYAYSKSKSPRDMVSYKSDWERSLLEFRQVAKRIKKITSLLKTKDWYFQVRDSVQVYIPHSFIMDSRYNTLYQMNLELKRYTFQIEFAHEFSYTWKRSSYLYEMWCYLKIVHLLAEEYETDYAGWGNKFAGKIMFPFLNAGTVVEFYNEEIFLKVVFDSPLVFHSKYADENMPLYITKTQEYSKMHNRPDILIHVFDRSNNWYLGAIVLECKYRKINSFWNENSPRSSIGQLQAYYNNTRSEYLFGGKGTRLNIRPVKKVIVLTPDISGDGKGHDDFNILIKGFKPMDTEEKNGTLIKELNRIIGELKEISKDLQR